MAGPKVVSSKPIAVVSSKPIEPENNSDYTGIFSGEHPFIEFLPKKRVNPTQAHDDTIVTGVDSIFDKARNYITDAASKDTRTIGLWPGSKERYPIAPIEAAAGSILTEIPRQAIGLINSGTGAALSYKGVVPKTEVVPVPVKKPQLALPPAGGTYRNSKELFPQVPEVIPEPQGPRFIAGDRGTADAQVPYNYNLGSDLAPNTPVGSEIRPNLINPSGIAPTNRLVTPDGATITPGQFGETPTPITPMMAVNYGSSPGRSANILPNPENVASSLTNDTIDAGRDAFNAKLPYHPQNPVTPYRGTTRYNEGNIERTIEQPKVVEQTPIPDAEIQATAKAKEARANGTWNPKGVKKVALDPNIPPEIRKGVVAIAKEDATQQPSNFLTSVYKQITAAGGEELVNRAQRVVHAVRRMDNDNVRPYINALKRVSKSDRDLMADYVEGRLKPRTPEVQNAVNAWKEAQTKLSTEAEKAGIRLYDGDKFEPFKAQPGDYWPHIPSEKKTDFIDKLVASGKTVKEAQDILENVRKNGELIHGFQNVRKDAVFDYVKSADVGVAHLRNLAKKIAQHIEFGPLDINGRGNEGIYDLIHATKDPKLVSTLMQRIVGRDEFSIPKLNQYLSTAKRWQSITKLMNFSIPNVALGQMANTFKASSHPIEVAKELRNLLSKTYRDELRSAGIYEDVAYSLGEEFDNFKHISSITNDPFAIGAGEKINRMVAAAIGKVVARAHFNAIKSGNVGFRNEYGKELSSLVSDNLDKIMKQDKLTPEQLQQAAGRMAEITQGLSVPGNLPYGWSTPVKDTEQLGKQMMLIFKKVGFQNTKMLWDGVKANPKRNIPILLGLSQVAGPLVGGSKSILKSAWSGKSPKEEWDKRDDWVTQAIGKDQLRAVSNATGIPEWVITRGLDNVSQSFMLGLPADLFNSASTGPTGLASALAGPVIGDASELAYDVAQIPKDKGKKLGRKVLSSLPIPGSRGLADRLLPNK